MSQLRPCRLQLRLSGGDRRRWPRPVALAPWPAGPRPPTLPPLPRRCLRSTGPWRCRSAVWHRPAAVARRQAAVWMFLTLSLALVDFLALLAAYCRFAGFWLVREQTSRADPYASARAIAVFGAPVVQSLGCLRRSPGRSSSRRNRTLPERPRHSLELAAAGRGLSMLRQDRVSLARTKPTTVNLWWRSTVPPAMSVFSVTFKVLPTANLSRSFMSNAISPVRFGSRPSVTS